MNDVPSDLDRKTDIEQIFQDLDPYTMHIQAGDLAELQKATVGRFGGIGIEVAMVDGKLTVISPLLDTPAYRAGVLSGDRIVAIDGHYTQGMGLEEAIHRIMGPVGSTVRLALVHPGGRVPVEVPIRRDLIKVRTVTGECRSADGRWQHVIEPTWKIGYVRLTAFTNDTAEDLRQVLRRLASEGVRGLVLDLRNNPGGVVRAAVDVADCFLDQGVIVSVRARDRPAQTYVATPAGPWQTQALVVLVNRYSASASEIVAAALQDHRRARIVGERTFGKGSVQQVLLLGDGQGALKVTTAVYYSPRGRTFDCDSGGGLEPDVPVRLTEDQIGQLAQWRRQRDAVGHAGDPRGWKWKDLALARAVEVLQAAMADPPSRHAAQK